MDYCDKCNGPVIYRGRTGLALSHVAYWVWMHLPMPIALGWLGFKILPYAGNIAFACSCPDKVARKETP